MDAKGKERGILKLEPRPRVVIDTSRAELTPQGSCEHPPCSPQPSVDRLSVTWAEPGSMSSSGVNLFHLPSETPISNEVKFSTAGDGSDDEDYSVSLSAVLRQRRASVRRSRKGRTRRPSSPFLGEENRPRRRSSVFTTSSGDTAISMEDGQSMVVTQEQIFENIHLHKEVLGSVKQQPLGMRRKLKIVHQAKAYIKRHEGQLQERLAQSKSTRDIYARFNILMAAKWQQLKREAANTSNLLIPWELRIKEIESHFGSVVASYFTFLRWLFWVNLVIGFILLVFVIVPEYLTADPNQDGERKKIMDDEVANATNLLALWEFEGRLKYSAIFYGFYSNIERGQYRMPLAYFMTGLAVYVYSFVAILRKMAENSRMSKLSEKDDECIFSWKLFTGWDFMIGNTETAHNRIASVILGFKEALLEEAEKKKDLRNWRIISLRGIVNIGVVILLAVSAYAVVTVVSRSDDTTKARGWLRENETTIVVTVISISFPVFFELLGFLEHYHPRKQLRLQLARIMLLNLLNLYSLIFALFSKIDGMSAALDSLKPVLPNATVPAIPLHMSRTIEMTIPNSCIKKKIPCGRCSIVVTSSILNNEETTTTNPYSLPESTSAYAVTRKRIKRQLEESFLKTVSSIESIYLDSKVTPSGIEITTLGTKENIYNTKDTEDGITVKDTDATIPNLEANTLFIETTTIDASQTSFQSNTLDVISENRKETEKIWAEIHNITSQYNQPAVDDNDIDDDDNDKDYTFDILNDTAVFNNYNDVNTDTSTETTKMYTTISDVPNTSTGEPIVDYGDTSMESIYNKITTNKIVSSSQYPSADSKITNEPYPNKNYVTENVISETSNTVKPIDKGMESIDTTHDEVTTNTIVTTSHYTTADSKAHISQELYTTLSDIPETNFTIETIADENTEVSESIYNGTTNNEIVIYTTANSKVDTTDLNLPKIDTVTETMTEEIAESTHDITTNEIEKSSLHTTLDFKALTIKDSYFTTTDSTMPTETTPELTTKVIESEVNNTFTIKPFTVQNTKDTCPNISFNCMTECGNQNVTQVFYVSNCTVETTCYVTICSDDIESRENRTRDIVYLDAENRTIYNLSITTRKKLLKLCWETMFGQELVKLTMMDLVFVLLGTLFMDFFRALFVRYMNRCWCWDLEKKFPEYGDFKIAENILHLINNQGMVWMGMFFSPGLVVLNVFKLMIMMYLRSWAVMTCNVPHEVVFRVSKSNNFYLALLLTMLFLCVLPVGYTIVWVKPSWHCGPFSGYKKIYYILTININKILPKSLSFTLEYSASPAIVIPLLVLLILIIYYLTSLTNSLREANNDLKIQLRRERTEERRKMFQLADTRRRVGSSAMENTTFAKWKKALPSLPMSKSIDSDDRKTLTGEEMQDIPLKISKKRGGIFAKIVGMALDKKTDVEAVSEIEIASPSPNNIDDETDTDFHEALPREVLKIKDITIVKPEPKKRNSVEFKTDEETKPKTEDKSLKLKLAKVDDYETLGEKQKKNLKQKPKVPREDERKMSEKQASQSSTQSRQSDSIGSAIPVITISTTESDEEGLSKKDKKEKSKDAIEMKTKKTPDLKSLRRQSSVESMSEHKPAKEKKQEEGHKFQYSL